MTNISTFEYFMAHDEVLDGVSSDELVAVSRELEFGTLDNTVMAPGHLTITDLKLGEGEKVMAKANLQLLDYALGSREQKARHARRAIPGRD